MVVSAFSALPFRFEESLFLFFKQYHLPPLNTYYIKKYYKKYFIKLYHWLLKANLILIYSIRRQPQKLRSSVCPRNKSLSSQKQWELFQSSCETHLISNADASFHYRTTLYWPPLKMLARGSTETSQKCWGRCYLELTVTIPTKSQGRLSKSSKATIIFSHYWWLSTTQ